MSRRKFIIKRKSSISLQTQKVKDSDFQTPNKSYHYSFLV